METFSLKKEKSILKKSFSKRGKFSIKKKMNFCIKTSEKKICVLKIEEKIFLLLKLKEEKIVPNYSRD